MMNKRIPFYLVLVLAIVSCIDCRTIDNTDADKMKEEYMSGVAYQALDSVLLEIGADSGLVIVMDSQEGNIISKVSSHRKGNDIIHSSYESLGIPMIMRSIVYYSALQIDGINADMVFYTSGGVYKSLLPYNKDEKETIRDHNWYRGGYGVITMQKGFEVGSNIVTTQTIEGAMINDSEKFMDILEQQNIHIEEQELSFFNLMKIKLTPEEQLKWINNIAVDNDSSSNDSSIEAIKQLREVLRSSVSRGTSKKANSEWTDVSGRTFTWLSDYEREPKQYLVGFYGYFPSDNPICTMYIELSKPGLPASGSMAGEVFTTIIDKLYNANLESLKESYD